MGPLWRDRQAWYPVMTGYVLLVLLLGAVVVTGLAAVDSGILRPRAIGDLPVLVSAPCLAAIVLIVALVYVQADGRSRTHAEAERAAAGLRAARDEIAARERYLTDVLDAVDVIIVTTDAQGRIVHANRAAKEHAPPGVRPETMSEAATMMRIAGPDTPNGPSPLAEEDHPTLRALRGEIVRDFEVTVQPVAGERHRSLRVHSQPLRDESGTIIGTVSASYDITALREHQGDLAAFAGVVAHDLKSPLGAVVGYTERLADTINEHLTGRPLQEARHATSRLVAAVERMNGLINDLLAYTAARDAALNRVPLDLRAVIDEVLLARTDDWQAAHADGAVGRPVITVGNLPAVEADRTLLRQVLDNLIGNAFKYAVPGRPPRIEITAKDQHDGWIEVEVADCGIGIPDDEHKSVFDSFHRSRTGGRHSGTGLGLAICRRAIQRHGGTIVAGNKPGGGTTFRFTLPATDRLQAPRWLAGRQRPRPLRLWTGRRFPIEEPVVAASSHRQIEPPTEPSDQ